MFRCSAPPSQVLCNDGRRLYGGELFPGGREVHSIILLREAIVGLRIPRRVHIPAAPRHYFSVQIIGYDV